MNEAIAGLIMDFCIKTVSAPSAQEKLACRKRVEACYVAKEASEQKRLSDCEVSSAAAIDGARKRNEVRVAAGHTAIHEHEDPGHILKKCVDKGGELLLGKPEKIIVKCLAE